MYLMVATESEFQICRDQVSRWTQYKSSLPASKELTNIAEVLRRTLPMTIRAIRRTCSQCVSRTMIKKPLIESMSIKMDQCVNRTGHSCILLSETAEVPGIGKDGAMFTPCFYFDDGVEGGLLWLHIGHHF